MLNQYKVSKGKDRELIVYCHIGTGAFQPYLFQANTTHYGFIGTGLRLLGRLKKITGVEVRQEGDEEFVIWFPFDQLPEIAKIVEPKMP